MPQPALLLPIEDPLVEAYRSAWESVTAQFDAVANDPLRQVRSRRLQEILRSIHRTMTAADGTAEEWIATQFPKLYLSGVLSEGGSASELLWTQMHQQAVQELANDLFDDLLTATKGVEDSAKSLIREIARDQALGKTIEGRTAEQAGVEMRRLLEEHGLFSVIYTDGSRHGLAEYSQVAIRTKSAVAYNTGTLNQHADVRFFEVFDGPSCGWSEHDDPTQALGMVVTRAEAMGTPISHPNCRRAFGPRPDVTSLQDVRDLEANPLTVGAGNTNIGQLADQRAADVRRASKTSKTSKTGSTSSTAKTSKTTPTSSSLARSAPAQMSVTEAQTLVKAANEEVGQLPLGEQDIRQRYIGNSEAINAAARAGNINGDVTAMDGFIAEHGIDVPANMPLFRGVAGGLGDVQPGQSLIDPGFGSMSPNEWVAKGFASNGGDIIEVVGVDGQVKAIAGSALEQELIFERGTVAVVESVSPVDPVWNTRTIRVRLRAGT